MPTPYEEYIRREWESFMGDPARASVYREIAGSRSTQSVLDVGCGAGQELFVFAKEYNAAGTGVDISLESGEVGRKLFQEHAPGARVQFVHASAEKLPFPSQSFDVVISRLSLPYTHNAEALAEFSRVLKTGGILLLKIHHARFYLKRLWLGIKKLQIRPAGHSARVLLNGSVYFLTGRQPLKPPLGRETFQTEKMLRRELDHLGLAVQGNLSDSCSTTPSYVIEKTRR